MTGQVGLNWYLFDANGYNLTQLGSPVSVSGTGTQTLNFSVAIIDPNFDLSEIAGMSIEVNGVSEVASATVSNFTYTLIPTPGVAALLGLGGLVAARRRR